MSKWPKIAAVLILLVLVIGHYSEYIFFTKNSEQELFSNSTFQKKRQFEDLKKKYSDIIANDKHPIDSEQIEAMNFLGPLQDPSARKVALARANSEDLKLKQSAVYGLSFFDDFETSKALFVLSLDDVSNLRNLVMTLVANRNTSERIEFLRTIMKSPLPPKSRVSQISYSKFKEKLESCSDFKMAFQTLESVPRSSHEKSLAIITFWQLQERTIIYTNPNETDSKEDRLLLKKTIEQVMSDEKEEYFRNLLNSILNSINQVKDDV